MRTIFITLDSLNRHYLNCYDPKAWVQTPNIDRLAERGLVFDNHYCGSMPCMPARREMYTGRINFLETPWSPIQPWDDCLQPELWRQNGTYSHMITDHYHYFHSGGECYHTRFNSWEFQRGQEGDVWRPLVDDPDIPDFAGKNRRAYWVNREFMDLENDLDYSTPQCFEQAIDFIERNHRTDNWNLHLECFDPHEPFACPRKYRDMYEDTWDEFHFDWPDYAPVEQDEAAVAHIRKCYAGTLTMADVWLGKLLDKMDELDAWREKLRRRSICSKGGRREPARVSKRAAAAGKQKTAFCRELGADLVVDYDGDDLYQGIMDATDGRGVDVVYDPVGGRYFDIARRLLTFEGRLLVVGFASGDIPSAPANHALVKNYSVVGVHMGAYRERDLPLVQRCYTEVHAGLLAGTYRPVVTETIVTETVPIRIFPVVRLVGTLVLKLRQLLLNGVNLALDCGPHGIVPCVVQAYSV